MKILVVDDDELQLELAALCLSELGYPDCSVSSDPAATLAEIEAGRLAFDVLLLDISMPEIDGIEFCRRLKTLPVWDRVKVIMVTAMSDRKYIDRAFAAGASDYVMKPFDMVDLKHRIESVLSQRDVTIGEPCSMGTASNDATALIPGLTPPDAMRAYVEVLDRGRMALSSVTVFKVQDNERRTILDHTDNARQLVGSIARSILAELELTTFVLSYFGDGTFVCVTRRGDPYVSPRLARKVDAVASSEADGHVIMSSADLVHDSRSGSPAGRLENAIMAAQRIALGFIPSTQENGPSGLPDLFG